MRGLPTSGATTATATKEDLRCPGCGGVVRSDKTPYWPYKGEFYCGQWCAMEAATPWATKPKGLRREH